MVVKFKSTKIPSMSIEKAVSTMRVYLISKGLSELNIKNRTNAARYIMRKYGTSTPTEAFMEKVKMDMISDGKKARIRELRFILTGVPGFKPEYSPEGL
jgi:hypothetical protein